MLVGEQKEVEPVRIIQQPPFLHLHPSPEVSYERLKPTLYALLNRLSKKSQIVIHDVPPCVMPDAVESLSFEPAERVRVPACASCSMNAVCKGVPQKFMEHNNPAAFQPWQNNPRELTIEVNRACMFACPFCFYKNYYLHNDKLAPPKEKIFELIDQAVALGTTTIRLFGGDPLLRKDLMDILDYAKQKGQFILMNTNGIFKDQKHMREVLDKADLLIISLHGFDVESEHVLTGRGDFMKKILLNLRRATAYAPEKIRISTLVTTYVVNNFWKYARIISALGIQYWGLNRPMVSQAELQQYPWLQVKKEDVLLLAKNIQQFRNNSGISVKLNNYPWCMFPEELYAVLDHNGAYNGVTRFVYDIKGYFKPSVSMNTNLGTSAKEAWQQNPFAASTHSFLSKECQQCPVVRQCNGGSRTLAQEATGSWSGKDPWMQNQ